jgi:hypothetical protein
MKICGYVSLEGSIILGPGITYPQFSEEKLNEHWLGFWVQRSRRKAALGLNMTDAAEFAIIIGSPRACQ